ncbi:HU domain-containing protein [Pedobacter cryotolerans]|uniref:SPOR domain-containing protein n=1 Tax=Pedobacter cryotolerans TaxID=2571270 RepID=A0A4U1C216_9SPHI|nr:hypothetical protein [Pedobacter cryotolerans]TKB99790.1 hypothetical protein FA045_10095 [Pedobacter cryotolerans]
MDILLYLIELLKTRKTIGVAGLGTFYKQKSPGKYDTAQHAFVPPTYKLSFTTDLEEQEELANYISSERNITTESANYYIREFAERIQTDLTDKQEADLANLGKLKLSNGEINFTPTEGNDIGFDYYGLPKVTEIEIDNTFSHSSSNAEENILEEIVEENKLEEENPGQETEVEENVLLNDEQEVYEEISELKNNPTTYHHLNENPPVIETVEEETKPEQVENIEVKQKPVFVEQPEFEEEEPKKGLPFFMKFLIAFLIIVALGAIVYFINPNFFNNYFNKNFGDKQEQTITPVLADTVTNFTDTIAVDSLAQNNDLIKLSTDSITKPKIDSSAVTTYEVLVSAVATEKKANRIIANLAKEGVQAKKIKLSKTMINISAGTFLTEYEAKLYRDSLRVILKNQGIYIQPIKPKK